MKLLVFIFFTALVFKLQAQEIDVITTNARVEFVYMDKDVAGTIEGLQVTISINPLDLGASSVSGIADVNTLSTDNSMRDKHLKADDFFDLEAFAEMSFVSTAIEKHGEEYLVTGDLTIKDQTHQVSFVLKTGEGELQFVGEIYSQDFGISIKDERERSLVAIAIIVRLD